MPSSISGSDEEPGCQVGCSSPNPEAAAAQAFPCVGMEFVADCIQKEEKVQGTNKSNENDESVPNQVDGLKRASAEVKGVH